MKEPVVVKPRALGLVPTLYGPNVDCVNAPLEAMLKTETVFVMLFATYRKFPDKLTATAEGKVGVVTPGVTVENGEPATAVSVVPFTENTEMLEELCVTELP